MSAASHSLEIRLYGSRVGELLYDRGGSSFVYEDDLSSPDHYTLGQTFEDDPRGVRRTRVGVPVWFENLLPEGELRRQVVRELGAGNIGNYTLLRHLGNLLPGAVTAHSLSPTVPDDDIYTHDLDVDHPLRQSLAGFQLKYSVSSDRLTIPVSGNGSWWIVKFPDRTLRDLAANEYLTMTWLAQSGYPVPDVHLVRADSIKGLPSGLSSVDELVYLVERFDRTVDGRVHVEDFAQVANVLPIHKYAESGVDYDGIGRAVRSLTGTNGYTDFVRRVVAMIVVGNLDGHLKNWALIYRDRRTPTLAPVYDFHSLTVYQSYRRQPLALRLAGEQIPEAISIEHFRRLAETCGEDEELTVNMVRDALESLHAAWSDSMAEEALARFDALAEHYSSRLSEARRRFGS
jgi:serine/threonine-protein kinase HipA